MLDERERAAIVAWRLGSRELRGRAAIAELLHPAGDDDPARLVAEFRAAVLLAQFGMAQEWSANAANATDERGGWLSQLGPLATRRALGLARRCLLQHADDAAVPEVLFEVAGLLDGESERTLRREFLLRTSAGGDQELMVRRAHTCLQFGDVDGARAALAGSEGAAPPSLAEVRARTASERFWLSRSLADVARWQRIAAAGGDEAMLARLRYLQLTDADAAHAFAAQQSAAGAAAALPHAVLAAAALGRGRKAEADREVDLALALPGKDMFVVAVALTQRVLPQIQRWRSVQAGEQQMLEEMEALLHEIDGALAAQDADDARLLVGMRSLGWPLERDGVPFLADVDGLTKLAQELAGVPAAQSLRLAGAMASRDADAVRRALAVQPDPEVAALPELVAQRAVTGVVAALQLGWSADDPLVAGGIDDLERCGDARAHYLRGVLAWAAAQREGAPRALLERALAHFEAAQLQPFEFGAWPAHCAREVVARALGEPAAADEETERFYACSDDESGRERMVAFFASRLLQAHELGDLGAAIGLVDRVQDAAAAGALHAAIAAAQAAAGAADAARAHAERALVAYDASAERPVAVPPVDCGVLALREVRWDIGFRRAWAGLQVRLGCSLYVLPPLPSRARLQELATKR